MKSRLGATLTLAATLAFGACATAGGGAAEAGGPQQTEYSNTAQLFIVQAEGAEGEAAEALYQQALDQALLGIEADSTNAQHYYLAGVSYAGVGDIAEADAAFTRALELYPDYAADIEIAREQAWARSFNEAVNVYNAGNVDEAISGWEDANRIYDNRAEAYLNLAAVYTQQGDYEGAADNYQEAIAALDRTPARELAPEEVEARAESKRTAMANLGQLLISTEQYAEAEAAYRDYLEENPGDVSAQANLAVALAEQGEDAEATEIYQTLLASPDLETEDLFNVGVALFQVEEYEQAAEAFQRVTEMNPRSRDAWFNYANALYAQELWPDLIPVAERVLALDPLNENAALILARAYRDTEQNEEALRILRARDAAPVFVSNLQLRTTEGSSIVSGVVEPNPAEGAAEAGTPVQLLVTFYGDSGELGTQTVTVSAPPEGSTASFEAVVESPTPATGYEYEVVG